MSKATIKSAIAATIKHMRPEAINFVRRLVIGEDDTFTREERRLAEQLTTFALQQVRTCTPAIAKASDDLESVRARTRATVYYAIAYQCGIDMTKAGRARSLGWHRERGTFQAVPNRSRPARRASRATRAAIAA